MRVIITAISIVASVAAVSRPAVQTGKAVSGGAAIRACEVLTPETVAKYDTGNPKVRGLIPRHEEAIGSRGSSCNDGAIFVQINPFLNAEGYRKAPPKDWVPVAGVGDTAYFHNNRDRYAELMVWTGGHHFTIQLNVPSGATAESIKSNTIGIATDVIARLKSL